MKFNLPGILVDSLKQSEIKDLVVENAEVAIDNLLEEGTLKDIPILGNIFKLYSVSQNISNYLFGKKLLYFLHTLEEVPEIERIEFVNKLDQNPKFKTKVGENLMLSLEKFNDANKARYLASAFILFIKEEINYKQFQILSYIIEQFNTAYSIDLAVSFEYGVSNMSPEIYDHFLNCGILKSKGSHEDLIAGYRDTFFKSEMGRILAKKIITFPKELIKEYYINFILDINITDSIGNYVKEVKTLNTKQQAQIFLNSLPEEHFTDSKISGGQFVDKNKETRFRRIGDCTYEFFYDQKK